MLREYIFRGVTSLTIRVVGKKYISRGCDVTGVCLLTRSIRAFFTTCFMSFILNDSNFSPFDLKIL